MAAVLAPNPWFSIWLSPRLTIRRLLDGPPRYREHILATLFAVADVLGVAVWRNWGDKYELSTIFLLALGFAPIRMVFYLYVYPPLIWATGRLLSGRGRVADIRIATAWSFLPALWLALLWVPELALFGDEFFKSEFTVDTVTGGMTAALYAFILLEITGAAWFIAVFVSALAEAQRFAWWRAVVNIAFAAALFVLPIYFGVTWLAGKL